MTDDFSHQVLTKAAKYCAFKERAPMEVIMKLRKWGLDDQAAQQVINELKKENYLNETRFAKAFCHDKFEFNKWGKVKIRMAISRYQLDEDIVEASLALIPQKRYLEVLAELANKKNGTINEPDGFIKKQKVASYLVNKGFEMDLVFSTLGKMSFS